MVESSLTSEPDTNLISSRKKRRRIGSESPIGDPSEQRGAKWRTVTEQQIYSSKLVDALRQIRRSDTSVGSVRYAADRVLAVSAKGRTRWSRALLTHRLTLRLSHIRRKRRRATRPNSCCKKPSAQKKLPPVKRRVRVLRRLVPGCRKLSLPTLLEETTDYIAALEMQVKVMAFIAGILNGAVGGGEGGASLAN